MFGYLMKRSYTLPHVWYITSNLRRILVTVLQFVMSAVPITTSATHAFYRTCMASSFQHLKFRFILTEKGLIIWYGVSILLGFRFQNELIVLVVTDSRVLNTLSGNFTKKTHPEAPRFASWLRSRVFLTRTFEYYSILILSQYGHKTVLIICDFDRTYESFY